MQTNFGWKFLHFNLYLYSQFNPIHILLLFQNSGAFENYRYMKSLFYTELTYIHIQYTYLFIRSMRSHVMVAFVIFVLMMTTPQRL